MASAVSDPIDDDLSETCWRDDQWIAAYGLLSPATVLDYFANSPFYDRSCNNEAARQRGLRVEQLA
jgi:mediator of RNA polymerase II transcription subunit 6